MLINESVAREFATHVLESSKITAIEAHKYIGSHEKIFGHVKYPERMVIFPKDNPEFAEFFEQIPFLIHNIPRYRNNEWSEKIKNYGGIFQSYSSDHLDCTNYEQFDSLFEYVKAVPELVKILVPGNGDLKNKLKGIVTEIVTRYLYVTKGTKDIPEDLDEQLKAYVAERILRHISEALNIDIYVPICLATFEDDIIELGDGITIVAMSEEIQKSRQNACSYESYKEDWVSACATHMIVFKNYHFKNTGDISINSATQNCFAYPLQKIDSIIGAIRIVTGYTIGYEQILTFPIGWIDSFQADLIPLYGAKTHFVNPRELEKMWMNLPVSVVSSEQAKQIQQIYRNIIKCEEDKNKRNLLFALKRFNRCMLRNEVDDMATDATIGIEALLAGQTKSEITFTISSRIPVVFSYIKNDRYDSKNSRKIMKAIYGYRSKIVHGGNLKDSEMYIEIDGIRYDTCTVAVDFLRYALWFMTEHQEYLDAGKIDDYIDGILSAKTCVQEEVPAQEQSRM